MVSIESELVLVMTREIQIRPAVIQGAAEWTPIFQRVIKNERNNLQNKGLYFQKALTI